MQCYCVKDFAGRKAYYFRADQHTLDYLKSFLPLKDPGAYFTEDMADWPVKVRDLKHWELQRELEFKEGEDTDPGADADFVGHESLLNEDEEK